MPKHNFRQEQQKLIKLKRDALTAKKNKWTNPKVRSLAPLPEVHRSPGNLWAIIFGLLLVAGMGGLLFFTFQAGPSRRRSARAYYLGSGQPGRIPGG